MSMHRKMDHGPSIRSTQWRMIPFLRKTKRILQNVRLLLHNPKWCSPPTRLTYMFLPPPKKSNTIRSCLQFVMGPSLIRLWTIVFSVSGILVAIIGLHVCNIRMPLPESPAIFYILWMRNFPAQLLQHIDLRTNTSGSLLYLVFVLAKSLAYSRAYSRLCRL